MAGYTRNDTSNNIATGNVINAADLDGEFDALVAAFHASTGHTHDGTAANGAPITKIGPAQDLVISTGAITPKTDNTVDLGSSSFEFKDLYIDGTANIDALVADTADINEGTIDGVTLGTNSAVTEAQIDNININGNTISSTNTNGNINLVPNGTGDVILTADTIQIGDSNTDVTVTTNGTGDLIFNTNAGTNSGVIRIYDGANGNIALTPNGTGEVDISKVDIDGGAIDGTTIGGSTAAAGSFTTLTTSSTVTLNGGTANGVLYLNGSKVATSGSALTYNGTLLTIGGVSAGVAALFIPAGDITSDVSSGAFAVGNYGDTSSELRLSTRGFTTFRTGATDGTNGSEQMRLTSTGLGIGTSSPGSRLAVSGSANMAYFYDGSTSDLQFQVVSSRTVVGTTTPSALVLKTNNTERATLDSSGNLGIGTSSPAFKLDVNGIGYFRDLLYVSGSHGISTDSASPLLLKINGTEKMQLDSSGNLGIGTSSPAAKLDVTQSSSGSVVTALMLRNPNSAVAGTGTKIYFSVVAGNNRGSYIESGAPLGDNATYLAFGTNSAGADATERARITSGGYFKASNSGAYYGSTGEYHEIRQTTNDRDIAIFSNTGATPYGVQMRYTAASPNGTGNVFFLCEDSTAQRASIRSNGGLANYQSNNVDLSDARTKKDITPAPSYWSKIGALEIVTYKYNDQTHDDVNVGVIAQQVEQVEPVWVDVDGFGETPEDGVPLKTVYTKDITFAAIKALQEAMARIETLEAKVSALEGN